MSEAIVAEGLGKRFNLGPTGWQSLLRLGTSRPEYWAFKDVDFTIQVGEAVGVVGQNGAGKSTLLKVLSRITAPTSGRALVRGRVGSILEIGTGFHPELTGAENIYLGGVLMGLTKEEVKQRFDEIVAFAELEGFLTVPVKRYSSGMYVRLAFAVAAHLQPDILIVDEVLAVGDSAFQRKSLDKMDRSVHEDERTILFVSHNLEAVRHLCSRALLLQAGNLVVDGSTEYVLSTYAQGQKTAISLTDVAVANRLNRSAGRAQITNLTLRNPKPLNPWTFRSGEGLAFDIEYGVREQIKSLSLCINISRGIDAQVVTTIKETLSHQTIEAGQGGIVSLTIPALPLRPGDYSLRISLGNEDFSVNEDLLDSNVNLPHLVVVSDEPDYLRRVGVVDINYQMKHDGSRVGLNVRT